MKKLEKGFKVETFSGVGKIIDIADNVAVVSIGNIDKVFYTNDIKQISDLEYFTKSFLGYDDILEKEKNESTELYKSFLDRIYKGMEGRPDLPKPPKESTPKIEKPPVKISEPVSNLPKIAGAGSVKELLAKKNEESSYIIHPPVNKTEEKKKGLKNIFSSWRKSGSEKLNVKPADPTVQDLETGKTHNLSISKEIPAKHHVLSHISLNEGNDVEENKYRFHYKVGNNPNAVISKNPLDAQGRPSFAGHRALQGKIFLKGEKVVHAGKEYTVHSHINPIPAANGIPDFDKMLLKGGDDKLYSASRKNVKLSGPDLGESKLIELADGTKKYHHSLKIGDKIMKHGRSHTIIHKDDKGHMAERDDDKSWYYTQSDHYNKDFKHNEFDRNKPAEKGDVVTFDHLGNKKHREVIADHPDGAVVQVNKSEKPILVKHGDYEFTGKTAHELAASSKTDPNQHSGSQYEINSSGGKKTLEDFGKYLGKGNLKPSEQAFHEHISNLDKFVDAENKPHRKEQVGDSVVHHLGIGDVKIHSTKDEEGNPKVEIENPDVNLWGANHKVVGVDHEQGGLWIAPYEKVGKGKETTFKNSIEYIPGKKKGGEQGEGKYKGQKFYKFSDLKGDRGLQSPKRSGETNRAIEDRKDDLMKDLAQLHIKHGVTDRTEVGNVNYAADTRHKNLRQDINKVMSSYSNDINKINRGEGALEPDDYKPVSHNFEKDDYGLLDKTMGSDWRDKLGERISKISSSAKHTKEEQAKFDEFEKARQKVVEENKVNEKKPITTYLQDTYKKLKPLHEVSLNGKIGLQSPLNEIGVKNEKFGGVKTQFHVVDYGEGHIKNSHDPLDVHKKMEQGVDKIPFKNNPEFPPLDTGTQIRAYHSPDNDGRAARAKVLKIAKTHRVKESMGLGIQGNTNTPISDGKGVGMSGRGRRMGIALLNDDQIKTNKEYLKSVLKQAYPNITDEQHKQLSESIDKAKNPGLERMAIHADGTPFDLEKHYDDYRAFTKALDDETTQVQSAKTKRRSAQSAMDPEDKAAMWKHIPQGEHVGKYIKRPEVAEKLLKTARDRGLINDDDHAVYWDGEKGVTEDGADYLDDVFKGGFLGEESSNHIDNLKSERLRGKIRNLVEDYGDEFNKLKDRNPYYDLKPDLQTYVKEQYSKDHPVKKKDQDQGGLDLPMSNMSKAISYLLDQVDKGKPEVHIANVLKDFNTKIDELDAVDPNIKKQYDIQGALKLDTADNYNERRKNLKEEYFKKFAEMHDAQNKGALDPKTFGKEAPKFVPKESKEEGKPKGVSPFELLKKQHGKNDNNIEKSFIQLGLPYKTKPKFILLKRLNEKK